jgi:hypothetical protein
VKEKGKQRKFGKRTVDCVLVGYDEYTKGYRVWDIAGRKLLKRRNVEFDETKFLHEVENTFVTLRVPTDHTPVAIQETDAPGDVIEGQNPAQADVHHGPNPLPQIGGADENAQSDDENAEDNVPIPPPQRRSTRTKKPIDRYGEWETGDGLDSLNVDLPCPPEISYCLCRAISSDILPNNFEAAMKSPDGKLWKEAMDKEFNSLTEMNTWNLTALPPGRKAISSKWVYRIKRKADGEIDKFKARMVARGFTQIYGVDFTETFAPVVRSNALRALLSFAVQRNMKIHQMDVVTAYLNGRILEEIYMRQPEGYEKPGAEHLVCKLNKSLYGLKQSGRCWNEKLVEFLTKNGFIQLVKETSVFYRTSPELQIITVYVDDLVLMTETDCGMKDVKSILESGFKMVDLGPIHHLLGIEFQRTTEGLRMTQKQYVAKMLERFGQKNAAPVTTPADPHVFLQKTDGFSKPVDRKIYQSIVGSLLFLALTTRPDIQLAVGICARFCSDPNQSHLTAAKRILRYLILTPDLGLFYSSKSSEIVGYVDADFARDIDDRKSTTGHLFIYGGSPISWYSGKQHGTSTSTAQAEYIALGSAVRESMFLIQFFAELGTKFPPITIHEDNQAAILMSKNPVYHTKQKHIDVQFHFVREEVDKGTVNLQYCPSAENIADILTKAVPKPTFEKLRQSMGLQ